MDRLPVFLEKVARCEVRGETMHFIWDELDLAIPIRTCISNMAACDEAIAKWKLSGVGNGTVVPIRRKRR